MADVTLSRSSELVRVIHLDWDEFVDSGLIRRWKSYGKDSGIEAAEELEIVEWGFVAEKLGGVAVVIPGLKRPHFLR